MNYFIETYGCQMNFAETAALELLLRERGWVAAIAIQRCDLLIINTCSVRITAENRVLGRLGLFSAMKKKRKFTIILMGCMAERLHDELKEKFPLLDYVVGMFERNRFTAIFETIEQQKIWDNAEKENTESLSPEHPASTYTSKQQPSNHNENKKAHYHFFERSYIEGTFQSFIPIMNGCNNFCTYCIVPYVRGREISRPVQSILDEIQFLSEKGVREITLLGQNVNSYHGIDPVLDTAVNFPSLLRMVANTCAEQGAIKWIRFISSHPKDLSDELIEVMACEPRICKALHLPVQNGSNEVLARMNRCYTVEQYLALVEKLRKRIPHIVLTTDILIGFPGETQTEFEKTLDLMRTVQFDSAFMYHYNPREGTRAYDFPERIPDSERINRLQQVIDLQQHITEKKMKQKIGSVVVVLLESQSRNNRDELFGHTEQGEMVVLAEKCSVDRIGHFMKVQLQSVKGKTFRAVPIT